MVLDRKTIEEMRKRMATIKPISHTLCYIHPAMVYYLMQEMSDKGFEVTPTSLIPADVTKLPYFYMSLEVKYPTSIVSLMHILVSNDVPDGNYLVGSAEDFYDKTIKELIELQ